MNHPGGAGFAGFPFPQGLPAGLGQALGQALGGLGLPPGMQLPPLLAQQLNAVAVQAERALGRIVMYEQSLKPVDRLLYSRLGLDFDRLGLLGGPCATGQRTPYPSSDYSSALLCPNWGLGCRSDCLKHDDRVGPKGLIALLVRRLRHLCGPFLTHTWLILVACAVPYAPCVLCSISCQRQSACRSARRSVEIIERPLAKQRA